MKNLTIAYDTMQNGEVGEACVFIPMEDAQANKIKAAFEKSELLSKREAYDLRDAVSGFVKCCERARGRSTLTTASRTWK